jgi:hypothetical protein
MLRRHIACQWSGQAALFIYIKCRGCVAQRTYVRLHPLSYVTGGRPRGSIGSLPVWGAEAYTTWPGHVSAPDPCLGLIKARVPPTPVFRDPVWAWPGPPPPPPRGPGPVPGVWFVPVEVLGLAWRSGLCIQGSGTEGPDPLLTPWSISSPLATWRPWSHPRGGVGRYFAM